MKIVTLAVAVKVVKAVQAVSGLLARGLHGQALQHLRVPHLVHQNFWRLSDGEPPEDVHYPHL